MEQKRTFCRICEPQCPIVATVIRGKVSELKPDRTHPSGGVPCHKGLAYQEIHDDPDRLTHPARRNNAKHDDAGKFDPIGWDLAMPEIAGKIHALQSKYGQDAVAVYLGNPLAFNGAGLMMAGLFQDLLGTRMRFGANSQDAANKFIVTGEVYGAAEALMIPDIYNTDYLLCIGSNPKVSHWTTVSSPNDWNVVKDIRDRGGKIRFVNPRRTESSSPDTGPTLQIKPGTDVYFLAAVLNHIDHTTGFDEAVIKRHCKNVEGLRAFIAPFDAQRVEHVTGISADIICEVAAEIVEAPSAAIYVSTGVNQSRQGILTYWLAEMLTLVTGNLGRRGGAFKPRGIADHFTPYGQTQVVQTSLGALELPDPPGFAVLPGTVLPDLIVNGDIRGLIVLGGNPLLSAPGGKAARDAFAELDLLVTIDLYCNATGELADYLLPATDWLERPDINLLSNGIQSVPFVQYTEAIVPPVGERRNDWWILARLAQELGLASPLDDHPDDQNGEHMIDAFLSAGALSREKVAASPSQTVGLSPVAPETLFNRCLQHPDRKIDCCPAHFEESGLFDRCRGIFDELGAEPEGTLKLISLRTPYMHNSWFSNSARFRRGNQAENALHMCEADARAAGLVFGDRVLVSTKYGRLETTVRIDNDLRSGTVAMSHGFGHQQSSGLRVAQRNPGANCNALMPFGPGQFEPLSNMSWISGVPVDVARAQ